MKFIAAMDHSGGSTGGVLDRYEQTYTEETKMDLIHDMRTRMINAPSFNGDNIWGTILYKDTVLRGVSATLLEKEIVSFLKVDSGVIFSGMLKPFNLGEMINIAKEHRCVGTKMRSIVYSKDVLEPIVKEQFELAKKIFDNGLIPIIEPEIPIDHMNKSELETMLDASMKAHLGRFKGQCILKLTLPEINGLYSDYSNHPKVVKVVALSGGYSTETACKRLSEQPAMGASFSRALSENLYANQRDVDFNASLAWNIKRISEACSV